MLSTMLSAAIKRQCSSVLPLLRACSPDFDGICGETMNTVFFIRVTVIKIVSTPLDGSVALVLSVINTEHTAAALATGKPG